MRRLLLFLQLYCLILFLCGDGYAFPEKKSGMDSAFRDPRLRQARELLGRSFERKVVRPVDQSPGDEVEVSDFVLETVRVLLSKKDRKRARKIAYAVLNASEEFSLDPVFLMAVILNESSFQPALKGAAGEIGLMQVLPRTAKWISGLYHLEYFGEKTLFDPVQNIWIGAALLDKLRQQFDAEGRLYLSAYNVGPKKLRLLMAMDKNPKEYVIAVMKRYLALYQGFKTKGDLNRVSQNAREKVLRVTN